MSAEIRDAANRVLAVQTITGEWKCVLCSTALQRTVTGDIRDGVNQHYRTVHARRRPA